jgi:hypothetical protein
MTDHVKFAIDMSQGVELIGYPDLYRTFTFYCENTEYKDYADFVQKNGYEYSTTDGRYRLSKDSPKNCEEMKQERLQALIDKIAIPLIEKYNKKFNSN